MARSTVGGRRSWAQPGSARAAFTTAVGGATWTRRRGWNPGAPARRPFGQVHRGSGQERAEKAAGRSRCAGTHIDVLKRVPIGPTPSWQPTRASDSRSGSPAGRTATGPPLEPRRRRGRCGSASSGTEREGRCEGHTRPPSPPRSPTWVTPSPCASRPPRPATPARLWSRLRPWPLRRPDPCPPAARAGVSREAPPRR